MRAVFVGYAQFITRRPLVVLVVVALVSVLAVSQLFGVRYDDDVVRFLPAEDGEVKAFNAIASRFGAMEVALIALEAPRGETLFSAPRLEALRALTRRLARL
ncbi:MAG: hypothetical protein KC492_37290, partial [Myxococcales bacterium]|nr:hypothetical protein [Myxococcales bacterium]